MFKSKLRDQQSGIFEKSLRRGSAITEKQKREQWTDGRERRGKNLVSNEGELQENEAVNNAGEDKKHGIFYTHQIKTILDEILQEKLSNQTYDPQTCRMLCVSLSEDIKDRVKQLGMARFRLVCNVTVGSNSGQGFLMASRFLWNEYKDNFSSSCFQNSSLFAVAIVFGVLKE